MRTLIVAILILLSDRFPLYTGSHHPDLPTAFAFAVLGVIGVILAIAQDIKELTRDSPTNQSRKEL